jgi:uncharacterized protein with FMN-binding domain
MPNDSVTEMPSRRREPSRLPVRGTIAAVGTVGALALLLSVRGGPLASFAPALAAGEDAATDDEPVVAAVTETSGADVAPGPVTLTGEPIETRWGDVQLVVTVEGDDIVDVQALVLPDSDHRSSRISDLVEPVLREEAITLDRADVSVISGATYTSEAYALSLQSALDQLAGAAARLSEAAPAGPSVDQEAPAEAPLPDPGAGDPVTVTGEPIAIRWGTVQVAVTVDGTDIIDIETLAIPDDDRRSARISERAEPILREEAIATDSAEVSVVSGATYTSRAYAASLQSALDQVGA